MSFLQDLDAAGLEFFNDVARKPFSEQAAMFLNAYWEEVGDQAEFIFSVAWEVVKATEMRFKNVQYVHLYQEGFDLDFNEGLYFYEQLVKFCDDPANKQWTDENFAKSQPEMMTSIKRKQALREKVDANADGRISFLEHLLYQYRDYADPALFVGRVMSHEEHPEIVKARNALAEVTARIKAYEAEKARLENEAENGSSNVKKLQAKNLLAQLDSSPLWEELNKALITAEAAVRIASKKFGGASGDSSGGPTQGSIFWLNRDLEEKKKRYGKK
jgi:hypothetical protein